MADFLEAEVPKWELSYSLDRMIADLDVGQIDTSTPGLMHDPPTIVLSTEPAVLVTIDGEPKFQKMEQVRSANVEQVVNSPFLIVRDVGGPIVYLSAGGSLWYAAERPEGPWQVANHVPTHIAALAPEVDDMDVGEAPPEIVVATEPTELIVAAGEPSWSPVEGMDLLYMDNTDSSVFLEVRSQSYYTVLSGRWYRGTSVEGRLEWEHVANNELPEPFSDIPDDSINADVLTYVSGTTQAREASLDATVPQTSAIRREDVEFKAEYDGEPEFLPVKDTPAVHAAVNTAAQVFKVADVYFACDQGVWYKASSPDGPWAIAEKVPDAIYDIPPSSPHHNVTYVYVYESTPEVVYVGYTSGYTGSYHYHGCVVYGTGWWYNPWYRHYYYPRPSTWGFRVSYNPYHGWGFGVSWSNGPFSISVGRYSGGRYGNAWFGVGGYRPYPPSGTRPPGAGTRPPASGTRPSVQPAGPGSIYDRPQNTERNATRPSTADARQPSVAAGRGNDVLTDRDGNVYKRGENGGWQQREGNQWKQAENLDRAGSSASRPSQPSSQGGAATRPQLERDYSARQRGNQRAGGYSGGSRGGASRGGASRGGGRRR